MSSYIGRLSTEILALIFVLCLPSRPLLQATYFDLPAFVAPSVKDAPLLLCAVCSYWRAIATTLPVLWCSLDTENVYRSQLVQIWLSRARSTALSLRMARPQLQNIFHPPLFPPVIDHDSQYASPIILHLPALMPAVPQCRHLEVVDFFCAHHIPIDFPPQLQLESMSIAFKYWKTPACLRAATWMSALLRRCPKLRRLHWDGPSAVHVPWAQLTHLSWGLVDTEPEDLGSTLAQLVQLEYLRLSVLSHSERFWNQAASFHVLPRVTTLSLDNTAPVAFLSLPQMHHLILESNLDFHTEFSQFLDRSHCVITRLELWRDSTLQLTADNMAPAVPLPLSYPCIQSSLTRLVISSYELNNLFLAIEEISPGSLPTKIRLLRDIDRCFQIDNLPGISLPATSGVLAALLLENFHSMCMLDLDEHWPHSLSDAPELEHHVVLAGDSRLLVSRHAAVRREYEAWWNSADGAEFRAALDEENEDLLRSFDLNYNVLRFRHFPGIIRAGQSVFANTNRRGYTYI